MAFLRPGSGTLAAECPLRVGCVKWRAGEAGARRTAPYGAPRRLKVTGPFQPLGRTPVARADQRPVTGTRCDQIQRFSKQRLCRIWQGRRLAHAHRAAVPAAARCFTGKGPFRGHTQAERDVPPHVGFFVRKSCRPAPNAMRVRLSGCSPHVDKSHYQHAQKTWTKSPSKDAMS